MMTVFNDTAALSQAAAELFVQTAREAVDRNGRFTVALTGGSSPVEMYRLLAQAPYRDQVPWQQTYIFWGDERWVPLTNLPCTTSRCCKNISTSRHPLSTSSCSAWATMAIRLLYFRARKY